MFDFASSQWRKSDGVCHVACDKIRSFLMGGSYINPAPDISHLQSCNYPRNKIIRMALTAGLSTSWASMKLDKSVPSSRGKVFRGVVSILFFVFLAYVLLWLLI